MNLPEVVDLTGPAIRANLIEAQAQENILNSASFQKWLQILANDLGPEITPPKIKSIATFSAFCLMVGWYYRESNIGMCPMHNPDCPIRRLLGIQHKSPT